MIYTAIDDFVDYVQQVTECDVCAYMYGAVMTDDFTPNSTIDLLIVTPQPMTQLQATRLLTARKFLAEVRKNDNFNNINGAIISKDDLLNKTANQVLFYKKGKQYLDDVYPLSVIDMLSLKTQGKLLVGDDVLANVVMPTRAQVFAECQRLVKVVQGCGKADGTPFAYQCMFWLTRALYTIATNQIASDSDSMIWAMEQGHLAEKVAMQCLAYHVTDSNAYSAKMKLNLKSQAWQKQIDALVAVTVAIINEGDKFVPTVEVIYDSQEQPTQTGKLVWRKNK